MVFLLFFLLTFFVVARLPQYASFYMCVLQKMSGKSLEKEGYQNVECHLPLELEDLVVTSMNISFLLNGPLSPIYYPVITLNESKGKIAKLVAKDVGENLWKKKDTKMSSVIFHWS
ncbi:hypothetical protein B9Z55_028353 [Caenorhabditis nigoni]|uniref:Uncharacterized protein n=1 Tax=Caenorhabditis nigoni TaxID=1611254 RepID=A0A2G5SC32_9PELO|nr:hypothetical protein B9Z55_028353 [Caenorhabditis nigoni]